MPLDRHALLRRLRMVMVLKVQSMAGGLLMLLLSLPDKQKHEPKPLNKRDMATAKPVMKLACVGKVLVQGRFKMLWLVRIWLPPWRNKRGRRANVLA